MKMERVDLLRRLLAVSPAITNTESIKQSTCVLIRKGRFYTMNREVACSISSGLDYEMLGVVSHARKLIDLLKKHKDDEVEVDIKDGKFIIAGKNKRLSRFALEAEIFMAVSTVEIPKEWQKINPHLSQAIDLVHRCTKKKASNYSFVHFHPKFIEASDNSKMARWTVPTFVSKSVLVRGSTIRLVIPLGMTKGCETSSWLHFKNPFGLRVSLAKFSCDNYPHLDQFLNIRGKKVTFPKSLAEVVETAGVMLDDSESSVSITLTTDRAVVYGIGAAGDHTEPRTVDYKGEEMSFRIPPKLVSELVDQTQTSCEISASCLRVQGDNYVYCTTLDVVDEDDDQEQNYQSYKDDTAPDEEE